MSTASGLSPEVSASILDEMAQRAYNKKEHSMTTGEWFFNKFQAKAKQIIGSERKLYSKKLES